MQSNQIPVLTQLPFSDSGSKNLIGVPSLAGTTPGAASFTDGFPAATRTPVESGGTPPFGEDFNGIFNHITALTRWYSAQGPIYFDPVFANAIGGYPKGSVLCDAGSVSTFHISLADANNHDPATDTSNTYWATATLPTFTPVQQGGGIGQLTNKVFIGWSALGLKATVDTTDFGPIAFQSYVNGLITAEQVARSNGDTSLTNYVFNTFCQRSNTGVTVRGNFVPGDYQTSTISLNIASDSQGGRVFVISSANTAGPQPAGAYMNTIVNGGSISQEFTSMPMTDSQVLYVPPSTNFYIQLQYITTSGGGQPWKQVSINLSAFFVAG